MKRVKHLATLVVGEDRVETRETFAWNSAIRATEDMMRELARSERDIYEGEAPVVTDKGTPERVYTRKWTAVRAIKEVVTATVTALTTETKEA